MARISKLSVIEDVERFGPEFERSFLPQLRALLKSYVRFPNVGSPNDPDPGVSEMSIDAVCIGRRLYEGGDVYPIVWILVRRNNRHAWDNIGPLVRSGVAERHLSRIQSNRNGERVSGVKHA